MADFVRGRLRPQRPCLGTGGPTLRASPKGATIHGACGHQGL